MPEYQAKHPSQMEPSHPGAILREDVLSALGLSVAGAARQLRVSRQMLHSILAERSAVSPEMAVRLGKFCGNGAGVWLRMQTTQDCGMRSGSCGTRFARFPGRPPRRA